MTEKRNKKEKEEEEGFIPKPVIKQDSESDGAMLV